MMRNRNERLSALTQTAMLTAMLAVFSQIAIPMPTNMPLTLQTFAAALCAWLGGMKKGVPAQLLYLLLGAAGVPVFSGFRGGIGILLGLTGGFLWGFLLLSLFCAAGAMLKRPWLAILSGFAGIGCCHVCGVVQYAAAAGMGIRESFLLISAPYLFKDILSAAAAYFAAKAVQRALHAAGVNVRS